MRKVLVVEDNLDNLRLISYPLIRAGYRVISAHTGEQGILLARDEDPLFVIMDIMLPGIDGYETARRIKSLPNGAGIPIIAITSLAMMGDREKAFAAGCSAYFEKPFDPVAIVDQIHEALEAAGFKIEQEQAR
jgi:two-component system, cell cycle response regulator DivK